MYTITRLSYIHILYIYIYVSHTTSSYFMTEIVRTHDMAPLTSLARSRHWTGSRHPSQQNRPCCEAQLELGSPRSATLCGRCFVRQVHRQPQSQQQSVQEAEEARLAEHGNHWSEIVFAALLLSTLACFSFTGCSHSVTWLTSPQT